MNTFTIMDETTKKFTSDASNSVTTPSSSRDSSMSPVNTPIRVHECPNCGKRVSTYSNLQRHIAKNCRKNVKKTLKDETDALLNKAFKRMSEKVGTVNMKANIILDYQEPSEAVPVAIAEVEKEDQDMTRLLDKILGKAPVEVNSHEFVYQLDEDVEISESGNRGSEYEGPEDVSSDVQVLSETLKTSESRPSAASEQDEYTPSWLKNAMKENRAAGHGQPKMLLLEASDEVLDDSDEEEETKVTTPSLRTNRLLNPNQTLQEFIASNGSSHTLNTPVPFKPIPLMSCKKCALCFGTTNEVKDHMIRDHGYVRCRFFQLTGCMKVLTTKKGESKHVRVVHKKTQRQDSFPSSTQAPPSKPLTSTDLVLQDLGFFSQEENVRFDEPPQKRSRMEGTLTDLTAFMEDPSFMLQ